MNIDKLKKTLDQKTEEATSKRRACFEAKIEASKLEKEYDDFVQTKKTEKEYQELCDNWYEAERRYGNAKFEADQATKKELVALEAYEKARDESQSEN